MHVFVTGGAGYIGSVCTEWLLEAGLEVTVFDNFSEGHRDAVDPRARCIEGDLKDAERLLSILKDARPDAVLHFAGKALVPESMRDPSAYFRTNVSYGIHLLDAMVAAGVQKIVFSSTCATYGVPERQPMDETLPQRPINPYGQSKRMFEEILQWYQTIHGLIPVNLRYFNAAGASERYGEDHRVETHLIPNILKVALGQRSHFNIFGDDYPTEDGTCVRDYIHVQDLAQAHMLALNSPGGGSYNLGTGSGFSVRAVLDAAREITGHPIPVENCPRRPGDPPVLIASSRLFHSASGWTPQKSDLHSLLGDAWRWHRSHPQGYRA